MKKAKVKWFNNAKGYGFVLTPEGEEAFVHHSAITGTGYKTLDEGETVECEIEKSDKGLRAIDVSRNPA